MVTSRAVLLRYDFSTVSNPGADWEHAGAQLQGSHTSALQHPFSSNESSQTPPALGLQWQRWSCPEPQTPLLLL